jgi:hypothetical protein
MGFARFEFYVAGANGGGSPATAVADCWDDRQPMNHAATNLAPPPLPNVCRYSIASATSRNSNNSPVSSLRQALTSSGLARKNSRLRLTALTRQAARRSCIADSMPTASLEKKERVDVKVEGYGGVAQFADPVHRIEAPSHTDLDHAFAKGPDV